MSSPFGDEVRRIAAAMKVSYRRGEKAVTDSGDLRAIRNATTISAVTGHTVVPVSLDHSDRTVFEDPADNFLLRAVHDKIHMDRGLGFTPADEIRVAAVQVAKTRLWYQLDMQIETLGQLLWRALTGQFPGDQRAFAAAIKDHIETSRELHGKEMSVPDAVVHLIEERRTFE